MDAEAPPDNVIAKEATALLRLWKAKHGAMSQDKFGDKYDLGTQGNVSHYLHGRQALTLKAARAFSSHLSCPIADFSPRIADEIEKQQRSAGWPFPRIDRKLVDDLPEGKKLILEGRILEWLEESDSLQSRGRRRS